MRTLKLLTHAAPRDEWETVCRVWDEEFPNARMADVFESIDPTPIASASLAQVRRRKAATTAVVQGCESSGGCRPRGLDALVHTRERGGAPAAG